MIIMMKASACTLRQNPRGAPATSSPPRSRAISRGVRARGFRPGISCVLAINITDVPSRDVDILAGDLTVGTLRPGEIPDMQWSRVQVRERVPRPTVPETHAVRLNATTPGAKRLPISVQMVSRVTSENYTLGARRQIACGRETNGS